MFGNAMLTIVASTNATLAPSEAIASTVRGADPCRRTTSASGTGASSGGEASMGTGGIARSSGLRGQQARQVRVRGECLARGTASDLDYARHLLPINQANSFGLRGDHEVS